MNRTPISPATASPDSLIKLYDLELSGNCYKVRLFLSFINRPYTLVPVDFLGGAHKEASFLKINPFGELPVLTDGHLVLRDSQAILVYLARKYGGESWFPSEAGTMAEATEWLMVAENEIARGPNDARLHDKFGYVLDHAAAAAKSTRILDLMDAHLATRRWLVLDRPTIADVACFPYVALGHEGRVAVGERRSLQQWVDRIKSLPGFVGMPAI